MTESQHTGFYVQFPHVTPRRVEMLPLTAYVGDTFQVGDVISVYMALNTWRHYQPDRDLKHDIFWTDDGLGMGGEYINVCGHDKLLAPLWNPDELRMIAQDMENMQRREEAIRNGQGNLPVTCYECGASLGTVEHQVEHECPGRPFQDPGVTTCSPNDGTYVVAEPETTDTEPEGEPEVLGWALVDSLKAKVKELEQQVESGNQWSRMDAEFIGMLKDENAKLKDQCTDASRENVALRRALIIMDEKFIERDVNAAMRPNYWDKYLRLQRESQGTGMTGSASLPPEALEGLQITNKDNQ